MIFLDTNVLVYSVDERDERKFCIIHLIQKQKDAILQTNNYRK